MITNYFDEIFSLDFIIVGKETWHDKNVSLQPRFFSPDYHYSILINEEFGIQILDETGHPLSMNFPLSSKGLKNAKRYIEMFILHNVV